MEVVKKDSIKVIHFIGSGRSGTTLLNILLDNHPSITGVGELSYITRHIWPELGYCGCGKRIDNCEIWKDIYKRWIDESHNNMLEEHISLQNDFERYRQIKRLIWKCNWETREFRKYSDYQTKLYRAILDVNNGSIIADASKHPLRVWSLSHIPEIDLRVIHVIRDPRGVAWSRKKSYDKDPKSGLGWNVYSQPVWQSALRWIFINLLSDYVSNRVNKVIKLRYEDLIQNPFDTLLRIGEFVGLRFQNMAHKISSGESITVGHIAAGNRLRMEKHIVLRRDSNWKTNMSGDEKKMVWRITNWLMKKYGYS